MACLEFCGETRIHADNENRDQITDAQVAGSTCLKVHFINLRQFILKQGSEKG